MQEKESSTPDEEWAALQDVVYNTASRSIGKPYRRHQCRLNPSDQGLENIMDKRDRGHQRVIQTKNTRSAVAAYEGYL